MPAAAVIPAPVAYIKVVAVKKLVVGFLVDRVWSGTLRALCTVGASTILPESGAYRLVRQGAFYDLDLLL